MFDVFLGGAYANRADIISKRQNLNISTLRNGH